MPTSGVMSTGSLMEAALVLKGISPYFPSGTIHVAVIDPGVGSRRSILAVLIFHGLMNFTGEWLRISRDMYPFILSGNVLVALVLVALWRQGKAPDAAIKPGR